MIDKKVYFIGAGPGDAELITLKGYNILKHVDVVIYAGSLVNKEILKYAPANAEFFDSSSMNLDEIVDKMYKSFKTGKIVVRLHTGDPSIYGATYEQMIELDKLGVPYEVVPGVTSLFAAAAKLKVELTAPDISQTIVISRVEGRTGVPENEALDRLLSHGGTFVFYLSAKNVEKIKNKFLEKGWSNDTPVAICYKVSWNDEKIINCTIENLPDKMDKEGIRKHALIIVGNVLDKSLIKQYSRLYDKDFEHEYRKKGSRNSDN
ncbi:precorrin-4 C(11)-methyltransferase [Deferribacter abyssi]|uniref:precorrin-4 C(11)-methyltransferase n=1 Tax=Deferribacter abyssi TaxID=213806 RepID=UPI003C2271D4